MRQETSDTPSGSRHRHRVMSWCSSYHCVRCDVCCGRLWPSTFTQVQLWGSCTLSFFILCHFILQILWGCFFTSLHFVRHTSTVYTIYADTNCVDKTTLKDPFMGKGDLWVSLPTRKKKKKKKKTLLCNCRTNPSSPHVVSLGKISEPQIAPVEEVALLQYVAFWMQN